MAAWDDVIDFDNVGDWPMELTSRLRLLDQSASQDQRALVERLVREYLQCLRITTYHCTRLLASEVEAIKRGGLRPASPDLAREKQEAARAAGWPMPFAHQNDLPEKVWFYHRQADLQGETAGPLLRSWGGRELFRGSPGGVDYASRPYIIVFNCPVSKLRYVFGNSWCRLETRIISQYLAQSSPAAPEHTAFESCIDEAVPIEASDIIPAGDVRFSALTNYCDELHFHAA